MDAPDSLSSGATGMRLQSERLAVITENLANASTIGFQARTSAVADFEDGLRSSVRLSRAEGSVRATGVDTDLALVGPGYFSVATPDGVRYTRNGHMARDAHGFLCDGQGHRILGSLGPVHFPAGARVSSDGHIIVNRKPVDRLRIADLAEVRADAGYVLPSTASVPKRASARVQQGHLEDSSVDAIAEMTALIATQRAYEANQKSVERADETLKRAANEVGRARS